jgi:hypothetical protein
MSNNMLWKNNVRDCAVRKDSRIKGRIGGDLTKKARLNSVELAPFPLLATVVASRGPQLVLGPGMSCDVRIIVVAAATGGYTNKIMYAGVKDEEG